MKSGKFALASGVALVGLLAFSCDSSSTSPTSPQATNLVLTSVSVAVDGQELATDATFVHGNHSGDHTRFEVRLFDNGVPAPGHHIYVDATPPTRMGGMGMWGDHRFELWDDGTHGDDVPNDGIYCLDDFAGIHGFHHADAAHGEYRYEFWGRHRDNFSESNHVVRVIRVTD